MFALVLIHKLSVPANVTTVIPAEYEDLDEKGLS